MNQRYGLSRGDTSSTRSWSFTESFYYLTYNDSFNLNFKLSQAVPPLWLLQREVSVPPALSEEQVIRIMTDVMDRVKSLTCKYDRNEYRMQNPLNNNIYAFCMTSHLSLWPTITLNCLHHRHNDAYCEENEGRHVGRGRIRRYWDPPSSVYPTKLWERFVLKSQLRSECVPLLRSLA